MSGGHVSEGLRAGFIGLGDQGGGMASRLVECGIPTTLWARREASLEPFHGTGATFAQTPAELGEASDVVGICVVDDAGVEQVTFGADGVLSGMNAGSVLALHSTISLSTCHRVAEVAAEQGVAVIDAPVSGGGKAAAQGELNVLVGGDAAAFDRARPVLDAFGRNVTHLGPLGSGLVAKLINNTLHTAHYALARDALVVGEQLGLDVGALGKVLSTSSGNSFSLGAALAVGGFDALAPLVGALLRKDVEIFAALISGQEVAEGSLVRVADEALELFGYARS